MTEPTAEQVDEMRDLVATTHRWIDSMVVAGIPENAAVSPILIALVERHLRASGSVLATAAWLEGQARLLRAVGPELLRDIRSKGN